jgi:hypothetical protein
LESSLDVFPGDRLGFPSVDLVQTPVEFLSGSAERGRFPGLLRRLSQRASMRRRRSSGDIRSMSMAEPLTPPSYVRLHDTTSRVSRGLTSAMLRPRLIQED